VKLTRPDPFTVHTPVVELVTDFVPSPVVDTEGVKESPTCGEVGMLEIDGAVETNLTTVTDCTDPSAAR
jgi:hypothetical protein